MTTTDPTSSTDAAAILLGAGAIKAEQADEVRAHAKANGTSQMRAAITLGYVTVEAAKAIIAANSDAEIISDLSAVKVDQDAIEMVPANRARRWSIIPLNFRNEELVLATTAANYNSTELREDLRLLLAGRSFKLVVAQDRDIAAKLNSEYRHEVELRSLAQRASESAANDATEMAVPIANLILDQAITDRASDIHIEPTASDVRVRYRIDGVLVEKPSAPKNVQGGLISRLKIMANLDIAESRIPQDGQLAMSVKGGRQVEMRVSTLPTVHGEKVVMRILDNSSGLTTLDSLDFSPENLHRWRSAATRPSGLMLATGPTGSGKSSTLMATLADVSRPEVNVVSVEDPVERRLAGVNQVQVNVKAKMTFAAALRSILRQDPDIILIGEIRDKETADIAIEASLTGHLVLSTLHTNNAPEAATRLAEMGAEGFLIGSVLECAMAQRLVRRLCVRCKRPSDVSAEDLEMVGFEVPEGQDVTLYDPVGCSACTGTGYRGRIAVQEAMSRTPALERLIVQGKTSDIIGEQAIKDGMRTMKQDGWHKAAMGLTTISEVLRVVG